MRMIDPRLVGVASTVLSYAIALLVAACVLHWVLRPCCE